MTYNTLGKSHSSTRSHKNTDLTTRFCCNIFFRVLARVLGTKKNVLFLFFKKKKVMEKKRKRSEVWKVFMEVPDSNPPLVKCSICNSTLKYYKNTTNLKQHIQFHNQNQEPRIDDILLQLFTSTLLPLTLIQNEYFIHFVDSLNPKAKLPSYKTFANKIEQLYEEKKLFCKKKLLDITIGSLMIDGWSNNSNCFLGLIFHYIKTSVGKL